VAQTAGDPLTSLSGGLLPVLNDAMPDRLVPALREFLVASAGAVDVGVLLADYELSQLRRLAPRGELGPVVPVVGTDEGQCFHTQTVMTVRSPRLGEPRPVDEEGSDEEGSEVTRVLVPLSLRAERLGVLQVTFARPVSADLILGLQEVALATSYVLVVCGSFSDLVEIARRAEPMSVESEMQWNLQPLRAFSGPKFSIAGQLIPAYEVGGDCFDYNVGASHLDIASMDAMGHGVRASLLAALATAVMRNTRRAGGDPVEQVAQADRQLLAQFGGAQFVTALAMRLDLGSGVLELVNAGHPRPWLVRGGRATPVEVDPSLPAGLLEATDYRSQTVQLEAGDRLVVVTDGVLEAGAPGEEFGEERLQGLLLGTADLTPHQCVAEVLRTVRSYTSRLHDDATVICLDWGSSAQLASTPAVPAR
jgi:serine phosphatase RsbU (regulator of sigma subunit)